MATTHVNLPAVALYMFMLFVLMTQNACGSNQLGDPEGPHPILTLQLPEVIPESGTPDYDILIRFTDHHDNLYAAITGGSRQITNNKLRINLQPGERGEAKIEIYPHQRNSCAGFVGYAAMTIDRDGILPVAQVSPFKHQPVDTCLLEVDHRSSDNLRVGKVVSSAFSGSLDPKIDCGNECFAHVPKGSTVTFQATGTSVYVFSFWEVASVSANNPVVINGPTSVTARFSSVACVPGDYCGDDIKISNVSSKDITIYDIFGFGANDVWAVGKDMSQRGVIMHYSQRQWLGVTSDMSGVDLPALRGVWGDAASGMVWGAGGDTSGGALYTCKTDLAGSPKCQREMFTIGSSSVTFTGISGAGKSLWVHDGRAVYGCATCASGVMNSFMPLGPNNNIRSIAAQDSSSVMVVGQTGVAYKCGISTTCAPLMNICGTGSTPVPSYFAVAGKGTEFLAGGDSGTLCRFNGGSWVAESPSAPATVTVSDVAIAGSQAWAVGNDGYVESWLFGNRGGIIKSPLKKTSAHFYAVWSAGTDTWFGGTGQLLHYQ